MKRRTRLILAIVHFIARIQGGALWLKRKFGPQKRPPKGPERHFVYLAQGPIIHFMTVAIFDDKILEQYGILGQPAPREQHPPGIRDNIMDRVTELIEEQDYIPLAFFPGAGTFTLSFLSDAEVPRPEFDDFLADRGLGLITDVQGASLTIHSPNPEFAEPLIRAECEARKIAAEIAH